MDMEKPKFVSITAAAEHPLQWWFSTRGHLPMSGDNFDCHNWEEGGGQGYC